MKSVISSYQYDSPAEVIAKLITEKNIVKEERRESDQQKSKFVKNKQQNKWKNQQNGGKINNQNQKKINKHFNQNGDKKYHKNKYKQNNGHRPKEHTIRVIAGPQPSTST